jgi:hypothetical protein
MLQWGLRHLLDPQGEEDRRVQQQCELPFHRWRLLCLTLLQLQVLVV